MTIRTFDRIGCTVSLLVFLLSGWVAVTGWDWFPVEDDWGQIANIPPTMVNYLALLSPWVILLVYIVIRRIWFKRPL